MLRCTIVAQSKQVVTQTAGHCSNGVIGDVADSETQSGRCALIREGFQFQDARVVDSAQQPQIDNDRFDVLVDRQLFHQCLTQSGRRSEIENS